MIADDPEGAPIAECKTWILVFYSEIRNRGALWAIRNHKLNRNRRACLPAPTFYPNKTDFCSSKHYML